MASYTTTTSTGAAQNIPVQPISGQQPGFQQPLTGQQSGFQQPLTGQQPQAGFQQPQQWQGQQAYQYSGQPSYQAGGLVDKVRDTVTNIASTVSDSLHGVSQQFTSSGVPYGQTNAYATSSGQYQPYEYTKTPSSISHWVNTGYSYAAHYLNKLLGNPASNFIPFQSTVLVTGASSGIGFQFAKIFATNQFNLILVSDAREQLFTARDELLRQFPNVRITPIVRDLSIPTGARDLWDEVRSLNLNVDILINNAGLTAFGKFLEVDLDKQIRIIQLNVLNTVILSYFFGNDMMRRGKGKIINMSALFACVPGPYQSVYSACAAFLKSFSEALACELKGTGVDVTCLLPGVVPDTLLAQRSGITPDRMPRAFAGYAPTTDAYQVALAGYQGSMWGCKTVIPGMSNKIFALVAHFLPRDLLAGVASYLNSPATSTY